MWCPSVKIILLNKMCEYHKRMCATYLIFLQQWEKSHRLFDGGTRAMLTSWLAYTNMVSLQRCVFLVFCCDQEVSRCKSLSIFV